MIPQATDLSNEDGPSAAKQDKLCPGVPSRERYESRTGRGDTIRTCDILLPKQALYRAELRPDELAIMARWAARAGGEVIFVWRGRRSSDSVWVCPNTLETDGADKHVEQKDGKSKTCLQ
jgi:hypothetical protein